MSTQLRKFAEKWIPHYGASAPHLPDTVQNEFAALIMSQDKDYASEATGPDNPHWETKMLPALVGYLANPTDKDAEINFNETWVHCVTDYFLNKMQNEIDDVSPLS